MGDLLILAVQNEKVTGALRSTLSHKGEKPLHGSVILEGFLCLSVYLCPSVLSFSLLHGGVFFLGVLLLRLRLPFLFPADQIG